MFNLFGDNILDNLEEQLYVTRDADGEIVVAVEGLANITVRSRC